MARVRAGHGVDVEALARAGQHLGVKALGREVEAHRSRRVVQAHAGVGLNAGEAFGQGRLHHRGFAQGEAAGATVGQGQGQHQGGSARPAFQRRRSQSSPQAVHVQREGPRVKQRGRQGRGSSGPTGFRVGLEKLRRLLGLGPERQPQRQEQSPYPTTAGAGRRGCR